MALFSYVPSGERHNNANIRVHIPLQLQAKLADKNASPGSDAVQPINDQENRAIDSEEDGEGERDEGQAGIVSVVSPRLGSASEAFLL